MDLMSKPLTEEEQRVEAAIDDHLEAAKDAGMTFLASMLLNLVGLILFLVSPQGSPFKRVGMALFATSIICFLVHLFCVGREQKKRRVAMDLVMQYKRKNAIPFYQELTEMFADKKGVHVHLEESGVITVTDKRKEKENG